MNRWMLTAVALAVSGAALAKLPPPDEATKAKAAEAAARAGWQGKVDLYLLCKAQDRVAARYKSNSPAAKGAVTPVVVSATAAAPGGATAPAATAAGASASAAKAAAAPPRAAPTAASPTTASQGGSTPSPAVAAAPPATGCADPGPFTYAPPDQKPLETSGAHSPAATAASPPSVRAESSTMTPGKTGAAPKK